MQKPRWPDWTVLASLTLIGASALAQQSVYAPDSVQSQGVSSPRVPLTLQQPEELPAAANIEARPLPATMPEESGPRHQFPVRLAGDAQTVQANDPAPLRLTPRQQAQSHKLGRPAAPTTGGAIGTVAGSLGIVLGLFLVLVWCSRRFAPAGTAQLPKEVVELLGRTSLGGRQQVQLVRIGNKLLLVAMTTAGIETLTEVTDPLEVERLAALCRRGEPASATASFRQVIGQLTSEPTAGGFAGQSRTRGAA